MIPESVVSSLLTAALATTFLPISLIIIFCAARKLNVKPVLMGLLIFAVAQLVIQVPLIGFMAGQGWLQTLADNQHLIYALTVSLIAGLAEESVRFGGARLLKKELSFRDAVSCGLGYALPELVLFSGISFVGNALMGATINSAGQLPQEGLTMPVDVIEEAVTQLSAVNPTEIYLTLVELIAAVLMHVFATALIFKGVNKKNTRYYFAAVLAHILFSLGTMMLGQYMPHSYAALTELAITAAVALAVKSLHPL